MSKAIKAPNGIIYSTIGKMCQAYDVTYEAYRGRLTRGWSIEKALTESQKHRGGKCKKITAPNGITYNSINEMCVAYGIIYGTYNTRLKYGWSVEKALTEPVAPRINTRYI